MMASDHDWSTRARGTAKDALRYTRFVGVMKRALPAAAFVVVGSVLVFFFLQRQPQRMQMALTRLGHFRNDFTMVKPRLTGADTKGNPFVITADTAVQDPDNGRRANLKNVEADLTLGKQGWVTATAPQGRVESDEGWLTLGGGIAIFSDSGYELHTASARVDLDKGLMSGPVITGHGPLGTLRADRFSMDQSSRRLFLDGNVHMTMFPQQKAKP